jgi:protein-disulfide isomerase
MLSLPRRAFQDVKVLVTSPLAIALAVLWIGGAATTLAFFPREAAQAQAGEPASPPPAVTQDQRSELERFMSAAPRIPMVVPTEGAKVLIVKFADFQCPACSQAYQAYGPILAKYAASNPGAVRMVMKDFPLNPNCNAAVRQVVHGAACEAAVAVRLARAHNKADELEEYFYTHQPEMTPESVKKAAHDIGGITDWDEKFASTLELVKADTAMGQQLRVNQTPTFFINGIKIDGAWAPQFFDQAIAYELAHAK